MPAGRARQGQGVGPLQGQVTAGEDSGSTQDVRECGAIGTPQG